MKKVEVIIEKRFLDEFVTLLEEKQLSGYTILEIVRGLGKTYGKTYDLGITSFDKHFFVITICDEAEYSILKEKILPFIKEIDGLIYSYNIEVL